MMGRNLRFPSPSLGWIGGMFPPPVLRHSLVYCMVHYAFLFSGVTNGEEIRFACIRPLNFMGVGDSASIEHVRSRRAVSAVRVS